MIYLWNIKYKFFIGSFGSSYQIKYAFPAKNIKIITPALTALMCLFQSQNTVVQYNVLL